jgi:hypothetical protein
MTCRIVLSSLSLIGVVAASAACGGAELRLAVPTRDELTLRVPGADGEGQALRLGETSRLYEGTAQIARTINGGVGTVFALSEQIMALPPTDTDGETYAVWGPSEPRGLERHSFRFTVNRVAPGQFDYRLDARLKDAVAEEDFVAIWEGTSFPADEGRGHGTLALHWGALRSLDGDPCAVGEVAVDYAADVEPRRIDVRFVEVVDGCADERPTTASYHYEENADESGLMDYAFKKNLHDVAEDKPLEEVFAVRSRWLADGQGRADVRLSEGEIETDLATHLPDSGATTADVVECWDASFQVVFVDTTPAELEPVLGFSEEGDVSACAFAEASFSAL